MKKSNRQITRLEGWLYSVDFKPWRFLCVCSLVEYASNHGFNSVNGNCTNATAPGVALERSTNCLAMDRFTLPMPEEWRWMGKRIEFARGVVTHLVEVL